MEIRPGVHCLPIKTETLPPHRATNSYALVQDGTALVIDAISPETDDTPKLLAEAGVKSISMAAISHPHGDHYLGLERLLSEFGGKIVCHPHTRARLKDVFPPELFGQEVKGGEVLKLGGFNVRVIHTPGHSSDHICFYLEEEKLLFSGDTILGWGTSIILPAPEGDMAAYMESLSELAKLEIDVICPAHGPLIEENTGEKIEWYISHRIMRENLVLEALESGVKSPYEIAEAIYTEEDFKMHGRDLLPRAARSVLAHLEKLEKEGRVKPEDQDGTTRWGLSE
ncbi:MAG: MBL fold metallo-hydrolase [Deltaproteobacteria bacterium]|nr:MBL fold metallo-hydrolase [Deltaproteobacteria bacterium]